MQEACYRLVVNAARLKDDAQFSRRGAANLHRPGE
jgi:hypothetical protein